MRKSKKEILDVFFNEIDVNWNTNLPELIDAFEEVNFSISEQLTNNWGELFLIVEGYIGKYEKTCPMRYAIAGEPLLIPNYRHNFQFRALSNCKTYMITREQRYAINRINPELFVLHDQLIDKQQQCLNYRQQLRDLPNTEKYPFILAKYPHITKHVKQIELAHFMGMSRESLRQQQRNYD